METELNIYMFTSSTTPENAFRYRFPDTVFCIRNIVTFLETFLCQSGEAENL